MAAKMAVLAAMLAVLDAKLGPRDAPNSARSRLRALFERVRKFERRSYRFFVVFWHVRGRPELQFSSASAVFRTLRTELAPNARERRKSSKIQSFRSPKSTQSRPREPRNRVRTVFGGRKVAWEHAKSYRIFKSEAERPSQSAERAHVEAVGGDATPRTPNALMGLSDRIFKFA